MALAGAMAILLGGMAFLKLRILPVHGLVSLMVLILTFFAFLTVGMLSASFIMIFKQGDPIKFLFGTSSYFLGGILFPVEVLPRPFQIISTILPITHAVKAIRELLLARVNFQDILPLLGNLIIFIVALAPVSILFFRYAVRRAKRDGSLTQF
jgi:ABC-2 type transport system permease protein